MATASDDLSCLSEGIPSELPPKLTPSEERDPSVPHAPKCPMVLTAEEKRLAVANALRYFDPRHHAELAPEFARELEIYGHIYAYRMRPRNYQMFARPISAYPAITEAGRALQMMMMNNLDPRVAQFPHELVTYGGNGRVFSNWAQYRIVMRYLTLMSDSPQSPPQSLVMYSGHPLGLFPTTPDGPRLISTCGMVVPRPGSAPDAYDRLSALGVTLYGQMTAGSYCYIGPQGIVHGTTLTLLNAGRKYLGLPSGVLKGKLYVTSGLGGMSGAQGKAARIAGAVAVIAEVNRAAIEKRLAQGWVDCVVECGDFQGLFKRVKEARREGRSLAVAYHGNVVDLWEYLAASRDATEVPELASDQTSLHNPYNGGYYPAHVGFEEANRIMAADPQRFRSMVDETLKRHVAALNTMAAKGTKFWDYGNSFLLQASRVGADVWSLNASEKAAGKFRYPSYVEDIMGDIFSLGFGPFRWVCASGDPADLETTDRIAGEIVQRLGSEAGLPAVISQQYNDNLRWINQAGENRLVVGSQARILYSDAKGRAALAEAFNRAVADKTLKGPVVISRDHHDVSGTDSPYRETSDVRDGSKPTADMAVQNYVGDAVRGATWVALHNGGGVGWGESMNGGFGLLLDGTPSASRRAALMLSWDVNNGVTRRCWSGNANAKLAITRAMQADPSLVVTLPNSASTEVVEAAFKSISH